MSLISNDLIILTSPPASGKTYWICKLQEAFPHERILVISPLRALADECHHTWKDTILVMTPEEWLGKKVTSKVIVFDEYHLYLYWGDSFRPLMWEMFFEVSQYSHLTFFLTATMSRAMREIIQSFSCHFDSITWCDFGNHKLKYYPASYIKAPSKRWLLNQIKAEEKQKNVKLIFCKFREEVFKLEKELSGEGYNCISCVGGEAGLMKEKLFNNPNPDFIISTTVLSHGVNLPDIRRIYFLYQVGNRDFWIQMVARGGRRGKSYDVLAMERPYDLNWRPFRNFLTVLVLTLKQKLSLYRISL